MNGAGLFGLLLTGTLVVGCRSDPDPLTASEQERSALRQQIETLYERARESGQQVPKDVVEWTRQDLLKIGVWEYKVVDIAESSSESRQTRFNELGAERWEIFWVEPISGGIRVYLKRRAGSVLERIPLWKLRWLFSLDGTGFK